MISKREDKAESEPSGLCCSSSSPTSRGSLTLHSAGQPALPRAGAAKQQGPPRPGTATSSPAERDPTHLCSTAGREAGNCKQTSTQGSPEGRAGAKQKAKEACSLPAENHFSGTFRCRADPLLPCEEAEGAAASCLSTHTPAPTGMETGGLPGARVRWEPAALRRCLGGAQHHAGHCIRSPRAPANWGCPRLHRFKRMGRGRNKTNRVSILHCLLGEGQSRILLMSYAVDLAAKCISGIVTNYQNAEKRIRT